MRYGERNQELLTQLGEHLELEVRATAPARQRKFQEAAYVAADIEWFLPMTGLVNLALVRRYVPNFPDQLPLAGFILAESKDRAPRQFYQLAQLAGQRYPFGFLVTDGATAYRQAHRSLRTFRHLFGAGQCLVADAQQLEALLEQRPATTGNDFAEIREPPFIEKMMEPIAPETLAAVSSKNWTKQIRILLRLQGQQAGLSVAEDAPPIDFSRHYENGLPAFATVKRYLQPVLLEEIGHALGYYHSFTPIDNRPPRITTSWSKQFATIKVDVIWQMTLPAGLQKFLQRLLELDFALRYAVPLLHGAPFSLPLVGFSIERSIVPASAGRILMLSRGCRFGVVITSQSQMGAMQQLLGLLGETSGLANVRTLAQQQLLSLED